MYADPIVAEVRKAGQILVEQAKGDLYAFFQRLREARQQYRDRLVRATRQAPQTVTSNPQRAKKESDEAQ